MRYKSTLVSGLVLGLAIVSTQPAIAASTSHARSSASTVTTGSTIFAIDDTQHSVVKFPGGVSAPQTVVAGLTDPQAIAVDRYNNLYVIDEGARQLIRVSSGTGARTVLRTLDAVWRASMAVDAAGDLYLLDNRSIVKYAASTGAASSLGTSGINGTLTVDGAGDVSITGGLDVDEEGPVTVETHPASGTPPTRRTMPDEYTVGGIKSAIETPGGVLYIWVYVVGGSGAEVIYRLNPGSATPDDAETYVANYADSVDRSGNFYLMQTHTWCPWPAVIEGVCADDFAIDSILKSVPPSQPYASRPISGVSLPSGGMAVDDAGNTYAAEWPITYEPFPQHSPPAQLVRIDATSGAVTVLASGKYSTPIVASTVPATPRTVKSQVFGSYASLSWTPPASNGGSPITGYRLARNGIDSVGTGPWSTVVPATTTGFAFGNLTPGSTYTLTVQAINGLGTGTAGSATVSIPPVPASSPQTFHIVASSTTHSATEIWTPPASTGGSAITGYRVARSGVDSRGTGPWSTIVPVTARSQSFNLLVPGQTYTFSVSAITAAGVGAPAFGRVKM